MNRLLIVSLIVMACVTPKVYAQTGMTDQQVIEYVKQATQEGKEQKQIATSPTTEAQSPFRSFGCVG